MLSAPQDTEPCHSDKQKIVVALFPDVNVCVGMCRIGKTTYALSKPFIGKSDSKNVGFGTIKQSKMCLMKIFCSWKAFHRVNMFRMWAFLSLSLVVNHGDMYILSCVRHYEVGWNEKQYKYLLGFEEKINPLLQMKRHHGGCVALNWSAGNISVIGRSEDNNI